MENTQTKQSNEIVTDKLLAVTPSHQTISADSALMPPTPANQSAEPNQTAVVETSAAVPAPVLYDATATQRFPFSVKEDGELIETAHIFKPIDDTKHLNYLRELVKIRDGDRNDKTLNELTVDFWRDDLIKNIENLQAEEGTDFRDIPDAEEEVAPLTVSYLTVIVKQPTVAQKRKRSPIKTNKQTITTQAYFNGEVCEQRHVLQKGDEWKKKYNRIQRSQYVEGKDAKGETTVKFVPAYEDKIKLYDEMMIEAQGFAADIIAARFKLATIDSAFETSVFDAKK